MGRGGRTNDDDGDDVAVLKTVPPILESTVLFHKILQVSYSLFSCHRKYS